MDQMKHTTTDECRAQVEEKQREFAALLDAHPEAHYVAMAFVAGMESAMSRLAKGENHG